MGSDWKHTGSGKRQRMYMEMLRLEGHSRQLWWFCQDVRIMNTNAFCLNFPYCSIENSNINNKKDEINLPRSLIMIFSQILSWLFFLCMTWSKLLPGRTLHEGHTWGQVSSLSGAFMHPHGCTDHLSLKQSSSCLLCIIIGIFSQ